MLRSSEIYHYNRNEKLLIAFSAIVFLLMTYIYTADISLRRILFPNSEEAFLSTPIGKIQISNGKTMRQRYTEFEFKSLHTDDVIYPNDTLTTDQDSTMTVELKDGRKFELGPNSLVKLTFGSDYSVTGLVQIQVLKLTTSTSDEKKEISIAPKPPKVERLVAKNIQPAPQSKFSFTAEEYAIRKKNIKISIKVAQPLIQPQVTINVYFVDPFKKTRQKLTAGMASFGDQGLYSNFRFSNPGTYEWEAIDTSIGEPYTFARGDFVIDRQIPLIQTLTTLGSTNRLEGLATKKIFDGFKLRWKKIDGHGKYIVRLYREKKDLPILVKEMTATELILNKNNLVLGTLEYTVERDLGDGFRAISNRNKFGFEFVPPEPAAPNDKAIFTPDDIDDNNGFIFFTWSKTNYTDQYEFELSSDPAFKSTILKKQLRDNYKSFSAPKAGVYYWRVRSRAQGLWSEFSTTRSLTVR